MHKVISSLSTIPASVTATATVLFLALILLFIVRKGFDLLALRIKLERSSLRPLERLIRYLILIAAALIILSLFGIGLGGVWTAISATIAMFAIGFVAMWGVLSNVLCTVIMLFTQPFMCGDEVELIGEEGVSGKVVDLSLVHTTLKTGDEAYVQIPNNLFFQKTFKRKLGKRNIPLAKQLLLQDMMK